MIQPSTSALSRSRFLLSATAAALALSAALLGAACQDRAAADTDDPPAVASADAQPTPRLRVRVAVVEAFADVQPVREVGRLEPWRRVTLSAEVSARVIEVVPEIGDRLAPAAAAPAAVPAAGPAAAEADPVVVRLDRAAYAIALERAEAAVRGAEAALDAAGLARKRILELFERKIATDHERDRAEIDHRTADAAVASARAARDEAALWLSRTEIRAPRGHRVLERLVEPGQVVAPGQPVLLLADDRRLRLRFQLSQALAATAARAAKVRVEVKGVDGVLEARITRLGPEGDPLSGRLPAEAVLDNADGRLLAGMTAVACLEVRRSDEVLAVVPRAALVERLEQASVIVVDGHGLASRRLVEVCHHPALDPSRAAVRGVRPGERVAIERQGDLADGASLEPVESAADAPR